VNDGVRDAYLARRAAITAFGSLAEYRVPGTQLENSVPRTRGV